ncbi:hypothetical protein N5923_08890 [Erwiniaceae bacterium BAC15a-03b]|uniref:SH3 domain-containing protein n=1 Tax=Winslowiella arboricola TaxID=2978220 RepID=A0A9J6PLG8_9GAMM|nr:hypothetical protein [Winslowiella arboricola]MCU5771723.1 hypothetical protein [Winslowiella arboricola]MCU5777606.1 hypothetical protein [Winslowiella arboricola]
MIKILSALLFSIPLLASANDFCHNLDSNANTQGVHFDNTENVFKVGGKGRLQFYSAPDKRCLVKGEFVIPGNNLYAWVEYQGFYSVMYLKEEGDQVTGWVEKDRLTETHKGIAPNYDGAFHPITQ